MGGWRQEVRAAGATARDADAVAPAFLYEGFEGGG